MFSPKLINTSVSNSTFIANGDLILIINGDLIGHCIKGTYK